MNTLDERHATGRAAAGEKPAAHGEHTPPPGHHKAPARPEKPAPAEHDHEDLPKDLKKPHLLTVIGVGVLFAALLGGLFVVGYVPHKNAEKQAAEDAAELSDETAMVAVAKPKSG